MCEPSEYFDVKVLEYGPGMIVWHTCPLNKAEAHRIGVMSERPVLIVGQQRVLGASQYQVMPLTSNLNNFGIRVLSPDFENPSSNSFGWKPGVILCMEVHTVPRNTLERIIGCVPTRTLEKCVKAYSWVLGLTDEIPDFIQMSEEAMKMLGAGTPSKYIPVSLRPTMTNAPVLTPPPAGTRPFEVIDKGSTITTNASTPGLDKTSDNVSDESTSETVLKKTASPKYEHSILERIAKYRDNPVKLSPVNRQIADGLSINEQFDLYVGHYPVRKLAATKGITLWAATQIAKYTNYRNAKGIDNLVSDLLDHRMDSRYLTGRNELLYRLIDRDQMNAIRRSPKGYQKDIGRFGLNYFKDTMIGIVYGDSIF